MKQFAVVLLSIGLVACSQSSGGGGGSSSSPDTSYKSGACGYDVVSDYNTIVSNCSTYSNVSDCKSTINSFLAKYPGVNCKAEEVSSKTSVNESIVWIKEADIKATLAKLDGGSTTKTVASPTPYNQNQQSFADDNNVSGICGSRVSDSYTYDVTAYCSDLSATSKPILKNCERGLVFFLHKYPNANCELSNGAKLSSATINEHLKTIREVLAELYSEKAPATEKPADAAPAADKAEVVDAPPAQ